MKTTFHIYVLIDSLSFYYLDYNSLSGLFKTVGVILLVLIAVKQVFYYSLSLCLFSEDLTFHTSYLILYLLVLSRYNAKKKIHKLK